MPEPIPPDVPAAAPQSDERAETTRRFGWFCAGGFLLALPYGSTFLLTLAIARLGGGADLAGSVIAIAIVGTLATVLASGHILDALGASRALALSGVLLATACGGFAIAGTTSLFAAMGLVLGAGWGLFYTIGPIIITQMVDPATRTRRFALLSGSMMAGVGAGPLIGRGSAAIGLPVDVAFWAAALAGLAGGAIAARAVAARPGRPRSPGPNPGSPAGPSKLRLVELRLVLRSSARLPILMVGLGGCIFGSLSSFQTLYAATRGLDYGLFFAGFMSAVITGRLLLSGFVVRREPLGTAAILTGLVLLAVAIFPVLGHDPAAYLLTAALLGLGYGLTYSVINGQAASDAPPACVPQSLLLFSLSYVVGVFGFPFVAGVLIARIGMDAMLWTIAALAFLNWSIPTLRWLNRRRGARPHRPA